LVYFMGHYVVVFCSNVVYFSRFGMLRQEKSGNPELNHRMHLSPSPKRKWFIAIICHSQAISLSTMLCAAHIGRYNTIRVARFFFVRTYQNRKNMPNDQKLYQTAINYNKWP
jgi:hypothetical protein